MRRRTDGRRTTPSGGQPPGDRHRLLQAVHHRYPDPLEAGPAVLYTGGSHSRASLEVAGVPVVDTLAEAVAEAERIAA